MERTERSLNAGAAGDVRAKNTRDEEESDTHMNRIEASQPSAKNAIFHSLQPRLLAIKFIFNHCLSRDNNQAQRREGLSFSLFQTVDVNVQEERVSFMSTKTGKLRTHTDTQYT